MGCSRHQVGLFLHAHGQLTGVRRWFVESHLRGCSVCRSRWARWAVEKDNLRRAFFPLAPGVAGETGMAEAVAARIRAERALRPPASSRLHSPVTLSARLALAVVAAVLALGMTAFAAYWQWPATPSPTSCPTGVAAPQVPATPAALKPAASSPCGVPQPAPTPIPSAPPPAACAGPEGAAQ